MFFQVLQPQKQQYNNASDQPHHQLHPSVQAHCSHITANSLWIFILLLLSSNRHIFQHHVTILIRPNDQFKILSVILNAWSAEQALSSSSWAETEEFPARVLQQTVSHHPRCRQISFPGEALEHIPTSVNLALKYGNNTIKRIYKSVFPCWWAEHTCKP